MISRERNNVSPLVAVHVREMEWKCVVTQMTNGSTPAVGAAARESGLGIRVFDASGSVETRVVSIETVVMAIGAGPALPSVDATADEIGHQIDARPVILARISHALVNIYTDK